jgi:hypothetical protein
VLSSSDHWWGTDVLDFLVSTNGRDLPGYHWDLRRYEVTDREVITAAVEKFDASYNRY